MCTILPKFMTLPETWKQQKLSQLINQSIYLCLENRQFNSLIDPQLVINWSKRIKQVGREKSTWFEWKIKKIIAFACCSHVSNLPTVFKFIFVGIQDQSVDKSSLVEQYSHVDLLVPAKWEKKIGLIGGNSIEFWLVCLIEYF